MHDRQSLQYMHCAGGGGATRRGAPDGAVQEGTDRDARRRRALLAGGQEDDDDVEADPFDPSALFGGRSGLPAWPGGARPRPLVPPPPPGPACAVAAKIYDVCDQCAVARTT